MTDRPVSVVIGHRAEVAAAEFLVRQGFTICDMNWRRRVCEIDIVAQRADCLYIVEVKYRDNEQQGSGLERITPAKLRRLWFAAQVYVAARGWRGEYTVAAVEVSGPDNSVSEFVESITFDG